MNILINKINNVSLKAYTKLKSFIDCERGDTNFVSIIIILMVVLIVAAVVITIIGSKDDETSLIGKAWKSIQESMNQIFKK